MAPKNKNRNNNEDLKQEDILQAVVIADSFNVRFGPVTEDKPRALLPLVNVPLIDYTLEALASSGVQEVFVICCHLGEQVREHIKLSKWQDYGSPMTVTAIMSDSCLSMGDALREIDSKSLIRTDFVLITGDIVSNMDIGQVVNEHKARTQGKDKSSIMTMVFRVAQPGHRNRSKEDDMFLIEEGGSGRLLFFQKSMDQRKIQVPMEILLENDDLITHNDLMDCHICVCSSSVPTLFTDNFDYQTRDDFVKGILINEEIMGNKIHLNIVRDKYAARVSNMQAYDAISKDVICRWTYPFVPDIYGSNDEERPRYMRHNIYCSKDITLARGCELLRDVVVGTGTSVGSGSKISGSVIGKNCKIGENVTLHNAYLWDNVSVEDNCNIDTALIANDVTILKNVVIEKGAVLAANVVVGPNVTVPKMSRLMSHPQRGFDDSDDFGDDDNAQPELKEQREENEESSPTYGTESRAFLFKPNVDSDDEEEVEAVECLWGVSDTEERNSNEHDSDSDGTDDEDSEEEDMADMGLDSEEDEDVVDSALGFNTNTGLLKCNSGFFQELVDTLVRGHMEKITEDNLILETNSLKHAYTVPIDEVIASLPCAVFDMGAKLLKTKVSADQPILAAFKKNIEKYAEILSKYIKNSESQIVAINGLGDYVIRYSDLRPRFPQLLNLLYDADILSEKSIFSWFSSSRLTPGSNEALRHDFLKKLAQPFVKWLQEAEEESSEDEDDE